MTGTPGRPARTVACQAFPVASVVATDWSGREKGRGGGLAHMAEGELRRLGNLSVDHTHHADGVEGPKLVAGDLTGVVHPP